MGYSLHQVEQPGSPFLVIHEQIVLIPESGRQPVQNRARKLIFILGGECRHTVPGAPGADTDVSLRPGDILVLPHQCTHYYHAPEPGAAYRVHALRLAFDPQLVPPLLPADSPAWEDPDAGLEAFARYHFQQVRHLPGGQDPLVREVLAQFRDEAQQRRSGYRYRVHALCTSLVTLVARQLQPIGAADAGPVEHRRAYHVGVAKEYLQRHLAQPLRLRDVAAHVQLTEEYLSRLFRQTTGQTVFEYVRQIRLERARTLLAGSDLNLGEIAATTGFGSPEQFSRTFRKEFAQSPSEYRRAIAAEIG